MLASHVIFWSLQSVVFLRTRPFFCVLFYVARWLWVDWFVFLDSFGSSSCKLSWNWQTLKWLLFCAWYRCWFCTLYCCLLGCIGVIFEEQIFAKCPFVLHILHYVFLAVHWFICPGENIPHFQHCFVCGWLWWRFIWFLIVSMSVVLDSSNLCVPVWCGLLEKLLLLFLSTLAWKSEI